MSARRIRGHLLVLGASALACLGACSSSSSSGNGGSQDGGSGSPKQCKITFSGALTATSDCSMALTTSGAGAEGLSMAPYPGGQTGTQPTSFGLSAAVNGTFSARSYAVADLDPDEMQTAFAVLMPSVNGALPSNYQCFADTSHGGQNFQCSTLAFVLSGVDSPPSASQGAAVPTRTHGTLDVTLLEAVPPTGTGPITPGPGRLMVHVDF